MDRRNSNERQQRHRQKKRNRLAETETPCQKHPIMALAKAQVVDRLWNSGYESKFYLTYRLRSES